MPERAEAERLAAGLAALGIDPADRVEPLLAYRDLLARWNRRHNLTAVREPGAMIERHLLDSLSILAHLHGRRVADVGSGAGLPGLPLAICDPARRYTLIEAVGKKARFIEQARIALRLDNVEVVAGRVEEYRPATPFDTVVSRAWTSLAAGLAAGRHLLAAGGRWLVMKGRRPDAELAELPDGVRLCAVTPLAVPFLEAERHLVVLEATRNHA